MSSGSSGTFVSRKVVGHELLHADSVFVIELRPLCMFHVMIGHLFQDGDNFDFEGVFDDICAPCASCPSRILSSSVFEWLGNLYHWACTEGLPLGCVFVVRSAVTHFLGVCQYLNCICRCYVCVRIFIHEGFG
jgi:hypothetical protein